MMTTKQTRALSILTLALAGSAVGCGDPQADEPHADDLVLDVDPSILVPEPAFATALSTSDLVPAVGWAVQIESGDFEHLRVQNTQVHGAFPDSFTMNLTAPPATDNPLAQPVEGFESEPLVQQGYVLALPKDHPDEIVVGYEASAADEECTEGEDGTTCVSTYCDYYGACFTQSCNWTTDECTLIEGDPAVAAGLGLAKGVVEDYALIYLDRPAQRGSVWAYTFGVEELSAGYHLVKLDVPEAELTQHDYDCRNAASHRAAKHFEDAYGIDPDSDELNDDNPLIQALFFLEEAAAQSAGCKADPWGRIVDNDETLQMKFSGFEID
jgi:hypothetical protein